MLGKPSNVGPARVCVLIKGGYRRARRFIGGVSWPESRVQVRQTTKQVVVQRFGLTSDRFQNFDFCILTILLTVATL